MRYNTYNGWKLEGRQVEIGEVGQYRNEYGDYMFHKSQTIPRTRKKVTVYRDRFGSVVRKETQYY